MTLAHTILHAGRSSEERIVLLHGFTQNAQCWEPFASLLADETGMGVVAIDAPGHGDSPAQHDGAGLWETADLIAEVGQTAHYVGYSMGGRMALHMAIAHPRVVRSLTLIGATPGIADQSERAARRTADDALAMELLSIGVSAFVDRWLAQPLFDGLTPATAHRDQRVVNRAAGLASSLRCCGTGRQDDLRPRLGTIAAPTLVLVGEHDSKFAAIGRSLPGTLRTVPGAGHSAHLERAAEAADEVAAFVSSVGSATM